MLVGGTAATILGLLFVALSLNLDVINREENAHLRALAVQSFTCLVSILFTAFVFLIPEADPIGIGIAFVMIGLVGALRAVQQFIAARKSRTDALGISSFWRFVVPVLCFLGFISVGILVIQGDVRALNWLVGAIIFLIISATRSSWDLLVRVKK